MTKQIEDDIPAFPRNYNYTGHNGMTLRDYFAGQALAGMGQWSPSGMQMDFGARAHWAYEQADAMLKARKPEEKV